MRWAGIVLVGCALAAPVTGCVDGDGDGVALLLGDAEVTDAVDGAERLGSDAESGVSEPLSVDGCSSLRMRSWRVPGSDPGPDGSAITSTVVRCDGADEARRCAVEIAEDVSRPVDFPVPGAVRVREVEGDGGSAGYVASAAAASYCVVVTLDLFTVSSPSSEQLVQRLAGALDDRVARFDRR